jgi:hypothetical protein
LWQNNSSGEVDYWTMQGATPTSYHTLANVGTSWRLVGGTNLGDGTSDLLWQNNTSGEVDYWTMQGTAVAAFHTLANVGVDWQVTGALTGSGALPAALPGVQTASSAFTFADISGPAPSIATTAMVGTAPLPQGSGGDPLLLVSGASTSPLTGLTMTHGALFG